VHFQRSLWFLIVLSLPAQSAAAPGQRPAKQALANSVCGNAEHRQLDFWLGQWRVYDTAKGTRVGSSHIEPIMRGCAIKESYEAPQAPGGAYSGTSYSGFDRKDGKWHQLYVDVNGNVTWYTGGVQGGDMVLVATVRGGALQRMTYRPLKGGSVEQVGVISTDGGKTWQPGYDLTYRRH
jgi:hypothetical protein